MVIKKKHRDYQCNQGFLSLPTSAVQAEDSLLKINEINKRTHDDGWTIRGRVIEDYFCWVEEFVATHPKYGKIWGNFDSTIKADSSEAFQHFMKHHPPQDWNKGDI